MSNELRGSCLCGAVSYEATGDSLFQGFCQCLDCRKVTSGHLAAIGMPGIAVLNVGVLDNPEVFKPESIVYAKHALSWDRLDPDLPRFEAMPPMP